MINLHDTVRDAVMKLSAGNPGAATVCAQIVQADPVTGFMDLLHMDDMGMKGPAIWVGYKDFAGQDLNKFIKAIRSRDTAMIEMIRREGYEAFSGGRS